jgi:SAM domain (Sterile alpha motif)
MTSGNDTDFAFLTKLTDADLKELGVSSLGHRKRLLEAIAERAAAALSRSRGLRTLPNAVKSRTPPRRRRRSP